MALNHSWAFTETQFNSTKFLENTGNIYRLVSQKPYTSKKNPDDVGVTLTLQITKDSTDYGADKKTGIKRDNNTLNSFDVLILNKKDRIEISKGEHLKLIGFIPEKSFVIGFDIILRFEDVEKVHVQKK
ncbi:hypothetical protein [Mammaliicoccus vitulinus]|uniref:hypothetical protein n=1 Tax=Mammaliicoccus vitulinus TaxID=71237 RepID=UPI00248D0594|nr:hypothetical protein [Mammaliicoccus vitulinus]